MSGAIIYMQKDLSLSVWQEEFIISSLSFFSIVGALMGGQIAAKRGRKFTMMLASALFFLGTLTMVISRLYAVIIAGRLLLGIATGLGQLLGPLYVAELAPKRMRGRLVALTEISTNSGIVVGYLVAWLFYFLHDDDEAWRLMIALGCVPALLLFVGLQLMPESPRWLLEQDRRAEARAVLSKLSEYSLSSSVRDSLLDAHMAGITESIGAEDRACKPQWKRIVCPCIWRPSLIVRKSLVIGVGVAFLQQATGSDAIVYYTPLMLADVMGDSHNDTILLYTTLMGVAKLFFIFVAVFLLDRVGRRPLLLASSGLMTLALAGYTLSCLGGRPVGVTIFLQCLYVSAFSIGWGPICWVMVSEIFPLGIRSRGMALALCVNRLTAGVVAMCFLSMRDAMTPTGAWVVFVGISVLAAMFVWRYVPETKGKSLEDITADLFRSGYMVIEDREQLDEESSGDDAETSEDASEEPEKRTVL